MYKTHTKFQNDWNKTVPSKYTLIAPVMLKNDKVYKSKFFLTLKVLITAAADDKFCDIFPNFRKKIRYDIS